MVGILAANSAVSGAFNIDNSLRFNNDDSPSLTFTPSSAGDRDVFTWSAWIKVNGVSGTYPIFTAGAGNGGGWSSGGTGTGIILYNDQFLTYWNSPSSPTYSSNVIRDPAAWYHVVLQANDTTLKVFVNGVERSSKSISGDAEINNTNAQTIGAYANNTDAYFDGYMTEINFVDGTAKAATDFGEYNDNNVWIPKKYSGSYGTNGFFLEFKQTGTSANSSGIGADTSGNDNHFAVTNLAATDITEDTCTNNFATMNPLESARQQGGAATFAEGNLQITTSYVDANYQRYPQVYSTQAVSSGKWYFEMKISTSDVDSFIGIHSPDNYASDGTTNPYGGYASTGAIYTSRGEVRINNASTSGHGTFSQNDILGCALDIDNNKVYFHKNGTYIQSGDPAGNSGGQAIPSGYTYGFTVGNETASNSGTMQVNFGNPIHTISSGNTDGDYGNFEYAVPSGFYAVCTKRLAEFG